MTRPYRKSVNKPIMTRQPHVRALFRHMDLTGMTFRVVSDASGVDTDVLSNWRCGKSSPRLDLFVAVCDAVGLTLTIAARGKSVRSKAENQIEMEL